ncbi:S26 family signal peptidase [Halapricum hydrolyticum]|uniref:S26 family signal peptidase n=1 Tax=Halapricum hydrolyticum TaxID=2979991 RepID=A0AAE3ID53_9EURY|nr:S26 family signal peptidase [Halapricum hydrolyticum]MCU4718881.1 S26 family signal peptidase [Halapricum hydrolyticum]MCU4727841.1 S26 family signal peptidase [Halapricum hydrolyticum]
MEDDVPESGPETADGSRSDGADTSQPRELPDRSTRGYGGPPERGPGIHHGDNPEESGSNWVMYLYDLLSSVGIVVLIGVLLFTASGVWPPMVAIESGSMEPVMERGDLVFVMEADRFPGPGAHESGVVTERTGQTTGYEKFGKYGDVIVFKPDGSDHRTPVIHRAMFWVEAGENWVDKANPDYLPEDAVCEGDGATPGGTDVRACPAPHSGFITKGDDNDAYDQVKGIADGPVKPEWVIGTAEYSLPYLGNIRLSAEAGATNTTWHGTAATNAWNGTVATNATSG